MRSSSSTVGAPEGASILLFPLCDRRGLISELLQSDDAQPVTEPESLFFAWLLDLPIAVDPAAAASAIFMVSHRARVEMGQLANSGAVAHRKGPSGELATVRRKLYQLLEETRSSSFTGRAGLSSSVSSLITPVSASQGD